MTLTPTLSRTLQLGLYAMEALAFAIILPAALFICALLGYLGAMTPEQVQALSIAEFYDMTTTLWSQTLNATGGAIIFYALLLMAKNHLQKRGRQDGLPVIAGCNCLKTSHNKKENR